jgi:hypothetical protein
MKKAMIYTMLIICSTAAANAETYRWTDDQGVIGFTDDPGQIPFKYRSTAHSGDDITVHGSAVQQESAQQTLIPIPAPLGEPPKQAPLGNLPISAPLGELPTSAPLGELPKPAHMGNPPAPAPLGTDQPAPQ